MTTLNELQYALIRATKQRGDLTTYLRTCQQLIGQYAAIEANYVNIKDISYWIAKTVGDLQLLNTGDKIAQFVRDTGFYGSYSDAELEPYTKEFPCVWGQAIYHLRFVFTHCTLFAMVKIVDIPGYREWLDKGLNNETK